MEREKLRFAAAGDPSLLVFDVPAELAFDGKVKQSFAIPIKARHGGLLLAIPLQCLDSDRLIDEMSGEGDGILGPSKSFVSPLLIEDESGVIGPADVNCRLIVVDFSNDVLPLLHEYDPNVDNSDEILPFDADLPQALPDVSELPDQVVEWARSQEANGRAHFYSAREEEEEVPTEPPKAKAAPKRITTAVLAEQVSTLAAKVEALVELQANAPMPPVVLTSKARGPEGGKQQGAQRFPALSAGLPGQEQLPGPSLVAKAVSLVGPPPRVKARPSAKVEIEEPVSLQHPSSLQDPMLVALTQQSSALSSLVAHLTSGDAMMDLGGSTSSSQSSTTRGVQRREKLQGDLAAGTSTYFVQVLGQIHRKIHPARVAPKTLSDLKASGISTLDYLTKFGGYKDQRGIGLTLWLVAHVVDAMLAEDTNLAMEHLGLLWCSLEQAALDQGDWSVAFLASLVEEPPIQLFQDRMMSLHGQGRPFAPSMPSQWAAMILGYLKELEILNSKKAETSPTRANPAATEVASPKQRTRFPKKPKAGPSAQ